MSRSPRATSWTCTRPSRGKWDCPSNGPAPPSIGRSKAKSPASARMRGFDRRTDARIRPTLVVDEAHHLRPDVLEDLRLLTNYQMDAENRLCLVLLGHPELRRRLTMAVHDALAQRIVVRHHMAALTRDELTGYLAHRLRLAGAELPLFDPAAEEALFQATSGLPRKINLLAHHTLIAAALARAKLATADHVQAALPAVA